MKYLTGIFRIFAHINLHLLSGISNFIFTIPACMRQTLVVSRR
jgi:hypothetical protein